MFVESLTGYVSRLADAHAVSVGNLVGRELITRQLETYGSRSDRSCRETEQRSLTVFAGAHVRLTAGESGIAKVGRSVGKSTHQTNLRFLTLLPFEDVFSRGGLFRSDSLLVPGLL